MIRFEQGALDSLYMAKQAIERAITDYEACKNLPALTVEHGQLFAAIDNADTAQLELKAFRDIAETNSEA